MTEHCTLAALAQPVAPGQETPSSDLRSRENEQHLGCSAAAVWQGRTHENNIIRWCSMEADDFGFSSVATIQKCSMALL